MNQIPVDQLIWAVLNKDALSPLEKTQIAEILRQYEDFVTPPNICISETE